MIYIKTFEDFNDNLRKISKSVDIVDKIKDVSWDKNSNVYIDGNFRPFY